MSEVKVNKISPRSGTDVTLGDSGDTFTIPSGATINNQGTAVNFGATGSASWVTTVKTSSPFTAVAGEGYFVNTTGGAITVNLPAGTPGAVVAIKDYANTFDTNNCTLVQNGSDKIGGSAVNSILAVEGLAVTLVFIDATQGWLVTDSGLQSEAPGAQYITATSPCVATVGDYKIHTFTGGGPFNVTSAGNAAGSNTVDYLVVAGGGGGGGSVPGYYAGGGGGAGGFRESVPNPAAWTASPIADSGNARPVSVQNYTITVGGGGPGGNGGHPGGSNGTQGSTSTFSDISSAGGGSGGKSTGAPGGAGPGGTGGSGGGGGSYAGDGGAGNTPTVNPAQGFRGGGGSGSPTAPAPCTAGIGGGGGGALGQGTDSTPGYGQAGGPGATTSISNSPLTKAVGGASGVQPGGTPTTPVNSGNGGQSGGNCASSGANGGSGIVILRYKFQN